MDTIVDVDRLPRSGESITTRRPDTGQSVPGGKGANQAVAAARLCGQAACEAEFIGQFGNDGHAKVLRQVFLDNGVDIAAAGDTDKPSGQGLVFLVEDGTVSSIVVGGSNGAWPTELGAIRGQVEKAEAVLLQREIPEHVNVAVAEAAHLARVPVYQDVGGEDRPISDALLSRLSYVTPNAPELQRLTGMPVASEEDAVAAARALQARGARSVLVTRGGHGSLLLDATGDLIRQPVCDVPGGKVLDETGAGDSFRAAFAVCMVEGRPVEECLRFAAAAGAFAVSRLGAVPSLPSREDIESLHCPRASRVDRAHVEDASCASGGPGAACGRRAEAGPAGGGDFPVQFASRLNSMAARQDLWHGTHDVLGWIARQGTIPGLNLVDFNYPQHFSPGVTVEKMLAAVRAAGLSVGAVGLRYPKEFQQGALTNPNHTLWRRAVELTIEGGAMAKKLGAQELVIWSAFDGYDYFAQADYQAMWNKTVEAFRQICDAHPDLRVSLEHKPTDENTRFSAVGSAGAAKLLVLEVARPNMGVTVDVGHCLMAGENPAQSVALLGKHLFGVHLNDGHSRIGAEDGLMLGSVHPTMALELMYWLQKIDYKGHLYFDTFPRNEDPVRECEFNIRRAKALWLKAERLRAAGLDDRLLKHDALGSMELIEELAGL